MADVLLTGATGVLGRGLHDRLRAAGYTVRAASRSPPAEDGWVTIDLAAETGLARAVEDVDLILHAASDARGDPERVDIEGTAHLLSAAEAADVARFCYVSIVGIDEIPYSYYEAKLTAEQLVQGSEIPDTTIVRATQFHEFVAFLLGRIARLPVWPLPSRFELQPIAAGEAAHAIVRTIEPEPDRRLVEVGGPAVHTVGELADAYREARGRWRPIVRLPVPGRIASAFRKGSATCPDRPVGTETWADWLAARDGVPGRGVY